ncbi:hypothetical protein Ancab_034808 [Ancistrocladus abbreviatus]
MDPPPPGTAGATTAPSHGGFTDPTPTPTPQAKLRLLCSYGGKIAPRSHDKALCYVGGETRIVAVDRHSVASLSFLSAHLSHTLLNGRPFSLKYQLPSHDLDSLISITTDDDLVNMIDEYDRLSLSPQSIRLRFFLFPAKPDPSSPDSNLQDLKSETWFFDAFRNARRFADSGTGTGTGPAEGQAESEGKCGVESVSGGPESVVLETSSSFGSTGSSASASNLPAIRVGGEEGNGAAAVPQDPKVNLYAVDSIGSDSSLASPNFQPQNIFYQDAIVHPEYHLKAPSNTVETESNASDHSIRTDLLKTGQLKGCPVLQVTDNLLHQPPSLQAQPQSQQQCLPQPQAVVYHDAVVHPEYKDTKIVTESNPSDLSSRTNFLKKVQVLGYPLSQPIDQVQQQATSSQPPPSLLQPQMQLQYVQPGTTYVPHYYPNTVPATSYPTVYQPCLQQQQQHQQGHYQLNNPYPVYLMPVGQAPPYDMSMPGLAGSSIVAPTHAPLHSKAVIVSSPLVYDGLMSTLPVPEYTSKVYSPATGTTLPSNVPSDEHQHQFVTFPLTNQPCTPIVAAENANSLSEHEDPVHAQIYKSQPPAPLMPSHVHPGANSATVLSENLTQLHLDATATNPQFL